MKESIAVTTITERRYHFTKAEVETLLRREITGTELVSARIAFEWQDDINHMSAGDVAIVAINTVTERSAT